MRAAVNSRSRLLRYLASLLRYVSTVHASYKVDESVGLRCEVKRLDEAGVRLKLIQMRAGNLLSLLLIRRARLVPQYLQTMKRGWL